MGQIDYQPILFTYDISVFGRKCDWYLILRGFNHARCIQPDRMPRPDLERLGISYRRIPVLSIGRDIYIDSRLILEKLEQRFPENRLGSTNTYEQGLESIVQSWVIDGGPFWRASGLIPPDVGVMTNKEWTDDRQECINAPFSREVQAEGRKDALSHTREHFETLEHGLLADGRHYIFATDTPKLIDVHAIWPFDWVIGKSMYMGENLDPDVISEPHFPRVYAYVERFRQAIEDAQSKSGEPIILSSDDAIKRILESDYWEKELTVDELDPLKLRKGQMVKVFPSDYGSGHQDVGKLVSLCKREVVIETKVKDGNGHLRLHFPRHNFKIVPSNKV